jgi:hypothetical protein
MVTKEEFNLGRIAYLLKNDFASTIKTLTLTLPAINYLTYTTYPTSRIYPTSITYLTGTTKLASY